MNLDLSIVLSQVFAFLVMLLILKRFAWKPFLKVLADRKAKIQEEFSIMENQRNELQKLKNEYQLKISQIEEEAKKILHEATENGKSIAAQISENAQKQAKVALEKIQITIDQELVKAHIKIKEKLVDIVIAASEKLLGEKIDNEKEQKMVFELIEHVGKHEE